MAQGFVSCLPTSLKRVILRILMVVTEVIRQVAGRLKNGVLPKNDVDRYAHHLNVGNELCRGRTIPMSPQLINKVKFIYRKCQLDFPKSKSTPLMIASARGNVDMVWGFIQCAKEIERDLHTQRLGWPKDLLWLRRRDGSTALDIAIMHDRLEVAKLLLSHATREDLDSVWNDYGKIIFPYIHDQPKHDGFIFEKLEDETRRAKQGLPPTPNEQESKVYAMNVRHAEVSRNVDIVKRREYLDKLDLRLLLLNPNKNIFLHLVSKFGDVYYVKHILETYNNWNSLISCHNSEGETPVYVAAKEGQLDVLRLMFDHLKRNNGNIESLLIRPEDKHNALHIAIQNHHAPVVFLLLEEIPQLANHVNVLRESPLYLAAERSYFEIVKLILNKCGNKSFTGPNGKTAVHAAAISNSAECIKYLLQERPDLVNEKDEKDWTPCRYAVHYNSSLAMEELLNVDHSVGFQLVTQDNSSALHVAASLGHCETMKVLMSICLGSPEFDSKGRNILHVAIESKQTEVIEFIFQDESLTSLINQKDNNGDTPAHLLAKLNLKIMEKVIDSRVNIHSLNNDNRTPLDLIDSDEKRKGYIKAIAMGTKMSNKISTSPPEITMIDYDKELEDEQKKAEAHFKMVDNMVLVVTLIATATFAAAFTVPGGFNSDKGSKQGTPYLLRKAAFQAFIITDAIAFSCSFSVLLAHIALLIYRNHYDEAGEAKREYIDRKIVIMYYLTGFALVAMLVAIVTGLYVVLLPSLWLAIFICVLSIGIVVVSFFV